MINKDNQKAVGIVLMMSPIVFVFSWSIFAIGFGKVGGLIVGVLVSLIFNYGLFLFVKNNEGW